MKLYHGTEKSFNQFNTDEVYFFDNPEAALRFGPFLKECDVDIYDYFVVDFQNQSWGGAILDYLPEWEEILSFAINGSGDFEEESEYFKETGISINILAEWAKEKGYKMLLADNVYDDDAGIIDDQYVSLDKSNILTIKTYEPAFTR